MVNLEKLELHFTFEESQASGRRGYQISARKGDRYVCPGMGYVNIIRPKVINFEGHSVHYSLGINIPHLARVAELELDWTMEYDGLSLDTFL